MASVERLEEPVLHFERAALCLHFVAEHPPADNPTEGYPNCPTMTSMELDLLSYRYQLAPPIGSQCETHARLPVEIDFPNRLTYRSEGREVTLVSRDPLRRADLIITSTRFLRSDVVVWHAVLCPRPGEAFTEFDLIRLIHLYDGRTEATNLRSAVRFRLPDGSAASIEDLLPRAYEYAGAGGTLRAGTVQLLTEGVAIQGRPLAELLAAVTDPARQGEPIPGEWLEEGRPEGEALRALCGIVSGILDFDHLDAGEICDTLEPTAPSNGLLRLHRCTLTSIGESDRPMEESRGEVGLSPYLLIPHAVLLQNEALVDRADALLDAVLANRAAPFRALEAAQQTADHLLNRDYLPNLFNYSTERALFELGQSARGSDEFRAATLARLHELEGRIAAHWEDRRDRGQMFIAVLLALISLVQLKDIVFDLLGADRSPALGWSVLGFAAILLSAAIVAFWRFGIRR